MPPAGDGPLLQAYAERGDEDAFAMLLQRHWPQVVAVVRRASGSAADAEDGAQAVFVALARRARALAGRASLAGWLHLAALNVGRRIAAATCARRRRERLAAPARTAVPVPDLALALDEALAALPERERLPVLLHHREGRSHDEAAALLGWPVGTFAARLGRGRARLRRRLRLDEATLAAALSEAPPPLPLPARASS